MHSLGCCCDDCQAEVEEQERLALKQESQSPDDYYLRHDTLPEE